MANITLGYWDLRGLAEPIRYLLHYKNVNFNDKRYTFDDGKKVSLAWQKDKFSLDLDFPNLPYYIDGDVKLTQSVTILRYLAQKYGLDGDTPEQKLQASLIEQQLLDMQFRLAMTCTNHHEFEKGKQEFAEKIPGVLKLLADFLGSKKFLVGDEVTYVDFMAYDNLDFHKMFLPGVLNDFPNLKEYVNRVIGLPELQEYIHSSTYKRWPIYGPNAKFGYHGEEPKDV